MLLLDYDQKKDLKHKQHFGLGIHDLWGKITDTTEERTENHQPGVIERCHGKGWTVYQ